MEKWTDIYENTLTEDTDSIVIDGLDCTEVEAYIINPNVRDNVTTFFLTSSATGGIYGEPRAQKENLKIQYIMKLSLKKIKPYLYEKVAICFPYLTGSSYGALDMAYQSHRLGNYINVEKINGITLKPQNGNLEAGCRIYIRAR